jgi:predicted DNA-binding transcriptional regulator AlpA
MAMAKTVKKDDGARPLLGLGEIRKRYGLSRYRIIRLIEASNFPQSVGGDFPKSLAGLRALWDQQAIEAWLNERK